MSPEEFEREIMAAVRGAETPADAERQIKHYFSPSPLVIVHTNGKHCFGVLAQQRPGAPNISVVCER
ncbi:hypothetical protein A3A38_02075 [Candidatus Kaiserbacteria bacterium RIFCSPLOWO2_01_FULL_53_17]|uniref:Uncharacterized protein n=1 Tax=Candidatus Kaiserbacteria bacterium RIFCSPLOWO2_01_FULL_53_17 TaxID=1798511 RepID=A0A1F6EFN9_9BACT|nr:MAG: hypothetical protein A3A38_02075 [Candidatus Kaiserbacteria bacterium RIFCSPLOWO2_01_FULL_53_17]